MGFWHRLRTLMRHLWRDASDTRRTVDDTMLERLRIRVADSETRHTGEIRVYVESALPLPYVWRHLREAHDLQSLVRERATALFGELRVWDTPHNNGVLIYLLLAEHEIELVADRGLNGLVSGPQWQAMVQGMGDAFCRGEFESGLSKAVEEVSAPLMRHFPAGKQANPNALPDTPIRG
jgi:uncharacterized membrane protein